MEDGHVDNGISMVGKMVDKDDGNNVIAEASPLLSHHQEPLQNQTNDSENTHNRHIRRASLHISHLLNHEPLQSPTMAAGQEEFGGVRSRHLIVTNNENEGHQRWYTTGYVESSSNTLAMMMRELSFTSVGDHHESLEEFPSQIQSPPAMNQMRPSTQNDSDNDDSAYLLPQPESELGCGDGPLTMDVAWEATTAVESCIADVIPPTIHEHVPFTNRDASSPTHVVNNGTNDYTSLPKIPPRQLQSMQEIDILPLTETLLRISRKVFQPPVIGALLGLFIASFPTLRGLLENIWGDEMRTAPMKWMFDGIYSVGPSCDRCLRSCCK